jgi:hypothetical protein
MLDAQRRPGGAGVAVFSDDEIAAVHSQASASAQPLRLDPRFRRLTGQLHQLGPRPLGEPLLELARDHGIANSVLAKLEEFAKLDPAAIARLDAHHWPPLPLHEAEASLIEQGRVP